MPDAPILLLVFFTHEDNVHRTIQTLFPVGEIKKPNGVSLKKR